MGQSIDYGTELPEGFTLQKKPEPKDYGSELPEGFALQKKGDKPTQPKQKKDDSIFGYGGSHLATNFETSALTGSIDELVNQVRGVASLFGVKMPESEAMKKEIEEAHKRSPVGFKTGSVFEGMIPFLASDGVFGLVAKPVAELGKVAKTAYSGAQAGTIGGIEARGRGKPFIPSAIESGIVGSAIEGAGEVGKAGYEKVKGELTTLPIPKEQLKKAKENQAKFDELGVPTTRGTITGDYKQQAKEETLLKNFDEARERKTAESTAIKERLTPKEEFKDDEAGQLIEGGLDKRIKNVKERRDEEYKKGIRLAKKGEKVLLDSNKIIKDIDEAVEQNTTYESLEEAANKLAADNDTSAVALRDLLDKFGLINVKKPKGSNLSVLNKPIRPLNDDFEKVRLENDEFEKNRRLNEEALLRKEFTSAVNKLSTFGKRRSRSDIKLANPIDSLPKDKHGLPIINRKNIEKAFLNYSDKNLEGRGFPKIPKDHEYQQNQIKAKALADNYFEKLEKLQNEKQMHIDLVPPIYKKPKLPESKFTVENYEPFRQQINKLYNNDKNGKVGIISHDIKKAIDSQFKETLENSENFKNAHPDLRKTLMRARKFHQIYKTEFSDNSLAAQIVGLSKDRTTPKIESSKVVDKVLSKATSIEQTRKVMNILRRSGGDGKRGSTALQSKVSLRLMNKAFNGDRFQGGFYQKELINIGQDKIDAIYKNNPKAKAILGKISDLSELIKRDSDLLYKGSAVVNERTIKRMIDKYGALAAGVVTAAGEGGTSGLVFGVTAATAAHVITVIAKKAAKTKDLAEMLNTNENAFKVASELNKTYPNIARALHIPKVIVSQFIVDNNPDSKEK